MKTREYREGEIFLNIGQAIYFIMFNTLRTGDADLRFYVTTVQDG